MTHWWYTAWPDHDIPSAATSLLDFLQLIKLQCPEEGPPIVVHCSAGVGRTGTLIAIDAMIEQMNKTGHADVFQFVSEMRASRKYMVQKEVMPVFK